MGPMKSLITLSEWKLEGTNGVAYHFVRMEIGRDKWSRLSLCPNGNWKAQMESLVTLSNWTLEGTNGVVYHLSHRKFEDK